MDTKREDQPVQIDMRRPALECLIVLLSYRFNLVPLVLGGNDGERSSDHFGAGLEVRVDVLGMLV